jgi:hypothetical protein
MRGRQGVTLGLSTTVVCSPAMHVKPLPILAVVLGIGCGAATSGRPTADGGASGDAARTADAARDATHGKDSSLLDAAIPPDAADAPSPPDASVPPADAARDTPAPDAPAAPMTCADGAPVAYTRTSCTGTPAAVPATLASSASSASFGDVISLRGLDDPTLPCFPVRVCVANGAPTLIFSDEPESPSSDGVLYADMLGAGAFRAYVYHSNAGTGLRKFPVVLLNQGTTTVHATITAAGVAGPSQDYIDVGKQAVLRWYMSHGTTTTVDVPAGARVLLDADLDAVHAATNELAHAIIDFSIDGPVKLSVVSVGASEDATTVTSGLVLLPNTAAHTRGSFPGAALEIESIAPIDASGARHLRMGDDVTDAKLTGHDYVDNTSVSLGGNYGVSYALRLGFAAGTGSAVLLSPQGGAWGGGGSITSGTTTTAPGVLPSSQDSLATQTDAIMLGSFAAAGTVAFVSAGGSSLPVDLVTVPLP